MELYQAYTDYNGMMELTESMFRYLAENVCGSANASFDEKMEAIYRCYELEL